MAEYVHIRHTFEPVYDSRSAILILGSLPSVKSREQGFYYGHPQNRFWRVLSAIFDYPLPDTVEAKKSLLLQERIALWDVIAACDIKGSSDSSIRNAEAADIAGLLAKTDIRHIYANGRTAEKLYNKYIFPQTRREIRVLPSTSPANAAFSLEDLIDAWKICFPDAVSVRNSNAAAAASPFGADKI